MGSSLGPLFTNNFMISLEENTLHDFIRREYLTKTRTIFMQLEKIYRWYFCYVLTEKIDLIIHELNSFNSNIKFTYELELDNKLAFLDVCVTRINKNKI